MNRFKKPALEIRELFCSHSFKPAKNTMSREVRLHIGALSACGRLALSFDRASGQAVATSAKVKTRG
jgi:hypothetical protein